jgi:hypothetical protein
VAPALTATGPLPVGNTVEPGAVINVRVLALETTEKAVANRITAVPSRKVQVRRWVFLSESSMSSVLHPTGFAGYKSMQRKEFWKVGVLNNTALTVASGSGNPPI